MIRITTLSDPSGQDHAASLSAALGSFGKLARRPIDMSNEVNDADTADIFTEISRGVDKWLWKVEAHLQTGDNQACLIPIRQSN